MRAFLLLSVLATFACGGANGGPDSGLDSGAGVDGGTSDAGSTGDAGASDAGSVGDAGATDDAGTLDDAGSTGDGGATDACGFFATIERGCVGADTNCSAILHQSDCCGTLVSQGINHSALAELEAAEPLCRASYPRCRCLARPTMTDSGEVVTDPSAVQVGCIARGPAGICMTYVANRPPDGV